MPKDAAMEVSLGQVMGMQIASALLLQARAVITPRALPVHRGLGRAPPPRQRSVRSDPPLSSARLRIFAFSCALAGITAFSR